MGTPEHEVAEEIHRQQVQGQAAAQLTQPLLKRGWRIAYVGWARCPLALSSGRV
ncbi:hypothetical protein C8F00_1302 [Xanthomonas vasicola]